MVELRKICIHVNKEAERPSYCYFGPRIPPKDFRVDKLEGIGEIVYRLQDHGRIQCGRCVMESNYRVRNPVDKDGWHQHISANVAGLKVEEPRKDEYGDIYVLVRLLKDETDDPVKKEIRKYLIEEKGACPTAVNFQD